MDYYFDCDSWGAHFSLPYAVMNYLNECSEAHLKVLLCIFSGSRAADSATLSKAAGVSEAEAEMAVEYWCSRGVISADGSAATVIKPSAVQEDTSFSGKNEPVSLVESVKPTSKPVEKKAVVRYSQRELKEKIDKDNALQKLTSEIQATFQFSINGKELEDIINLYEYYKFDVPSILLCANYCSSAGKNRISYLYSVMVRWYEQDITSYADLEQAIIDSNASRDYLHRVLRICGIDNKPTSAMKDYIEGWRTKGVSLELVEIAYNKCMDTKSKLSFAYINGIINDWTNKSIATVQQVEKNDEAYKAKNPYTKKNNSGKAQDKETSYDLDEFENFALNFGLEVSSGKDGNK